MTDEVTLALVLLVGIFALGRAVKLVERGVDGRVRREVDLEGDE